MKDDELIIEDGGPVLIPPSEYDAIVTGYRKLRKFDRLMLQMRFRIMTIGPHHGKELDAYLPLCEGGRIARASKLARWYQALEDGRRHDRVRLKAFTERMLRVSVRTVQKDHRQRSLPKCQWYSVVDEVLGTVAKLADMHECDTDD